MQSREIITVALADLPPPEREKVMQLLACQPLAPGRLSVRPTHRGVAASMNITRRDAAAAGLLPAERADDRSSTGREERPRGHTAHEQHSTPHRSVPSARRPQVRRLDQAVRVLENGLDPRPTAEHRLTPQRSTHRDVFNASLSTHASAPTTPHRRHSAYVPRPRTPSRTTPVRSTTTRPPQLISASAPTTPSGKRYASPARLQSTKPGGKQAPDLHSDVHDPAWLSSHLDEFLMRYAPRDGPATASARPRTPTASRRTGSPMARPSFRPASPGPSRRPPAHTSSSTSASTSVQGDVGVLIATALQEPLSVALLRFLFVFHGARTHAIERAMRTTAEHFCGVCSSCALWAHVIKRQSNTASGDLHRRDEGCVLNCSGDGEGDADLSAVMFAVVALLFRCIPSAAAKDRTALAPPTTAARRAPAESPAFVKRSHDASKSGGRSGAVVLTQRRWAAPQDVWHAVTKVCRELTRVQACGTVLIRDRPAAAANAEYSMNGETVAELVQQRAALWFDTATADCFRDGRCDLYPLLSFIARSNAEDVAAIVGAGEDQLDHHMPHGTRESSSPMGRTAGHATASKHHHATGYEQSDAIINEFETVLNARLASVSIPEDTDGAEYRTDTARSGYWSQDQDRASAHQPALNNNGAHDDYVHQHAHQHQQLYSNERGEVDVGSVEREESWVPRGPAAMASAPSEESFSPTAPGPGSYSPRALMSPPPPPTMAPVPMRRMLHEGRHVGTARYEQVVADRHAGEQGAAADLTALEELARIPMV